MHSVTFPKPGVTNTVIDFLQKQVHDLNQELGDALGHIEMLQEQQMPPLVPNKLEEEEEDSEEEPEETEGVSEIDSEHGDPEPNPQQPVFYGQPRRLLIHLCRRYPRCV
jgi:hypothetical protein